MRSDLNSYYHYFTFGLSSYIDRLLVRVRSEVVHHFITAFQPSSSHIVLDVGISESTHVSSNYFERLYPYRGRIYALGIQGYPELKEQFPGITLVAGNARNLPFKSESFDFVYSHAVIEHVGTRANQAKFLAEALRVARRGVFITTPNRWHPFETHTGLPFVHYLPPNLHRRLYRALGKQMYSSEESLNLLSIRELRGLCRQIGVREETVQLCSIRWLRVISNVVAIIRKASPSETHR